MPTETRALRIANALIKRPSDGRTLQEFAAWTGLSERTARRIFMAETGMSFAHWRQQPRLTLALERLARNEAVADVAERLGYATPSNFIAMFRRAFGAPPALFFNATGDPRSDGLGGAFQARRPHCYTRSRFLIAPQHLSDLVSATGHPHTLC
ncbi:helix-turn-helix transcriptional regulator, partial [Bradyrhizobium canariense]|uniref:helix-turn-helix transcriptional regulator n=1 Tax=Bradyrhizobium canariense TaxID=255045 RepID=UPI001F0AD9BA